MAASSAEPVTSIPGSVLAPLAELPASVPAPFEAARGRVSPDGSTSRHLHHEAEIWVVTGGHGTVSAGPTTRAVEPGDAVYLPPFTPHTLRNDSTTEDLFFVAFWWDDPGLAARHARGAPAPARSRRVLVTSTPPTPNGDLHLGHLSGPYLGADIHVRFLRMNGVAADHVTGSDEFQTWVKFRAERSQASPADVAREYSDAILASLGAASIAVDAYTRPQESPRYVEVQRTAFGRLHATGRLITRTTPALYCPRCARYLTEVYVRGTCPYCRRPGSGNACEDCGRPNAVVDLLDPRCTSCEREPVVRECRRLFFPLGAYERELRDFVARSPMNAHLRALCEQMFAAGLPDLPVTQLTDWGIPVPVAGFEGQTIWPWFEMGLGYVFAAEELARARDVARSSPTATGDVEVVQFFGFDNAYYHALLFPAHCLALTGAVPPTTFVVNEFYRLDGQKFSTSRRHAIWAREFLEWQDPDVVRFYLCYTRPETEQTSFTRDDFERTTRSELLDAWPAWLASLGGRVARHFADTAPAPGLWTDGQRHFFAALTASISEVTDALSAATFSPQRAVRVCGELVRSARRFAGENEHWADTSGRRDEHRTAIALELAAARALAMLIAPIMPGFAASLWEGLGFGHAIEGEPWRRAPAWVPAGHRISLARPYFRAPESRP